ncbi:hypothetical protein JRO89_XS03G0290900 [Xanthoceras sorbifolium]|uniref:cytokinin riboside 5'-monophosphate phosphoribohydrolase n=1 Tax=Xanthoceras sorbifolium TaxID=99658 RepID=A0ABQ8IDA1_9ROSI|nr:hypothetical protein JRO89_XS03G0290900 [Xanthoceras sorbifolium]
MEGGDIRSKFKRVCVFCGSNSGHRKVFSDASLDLGNELVCSLYVFLFLFLCQVLSLSLATVKRKIDLVYGGGSVGLMGSISQTVYAGGCHVVGIIPKALMPLESLLFLGGYGTMEELLEMITWSQLGIHKKAVGLLNVDGYYNSLLALFDNGVKEGFIKPGARDIIISAPTAKELMEKMEVELTDFISQENFPNFLNTLLPMNMLLLMKAGRWSNLVTIQHIKICSDIGGRFSSTLIPDVIQREAKTYIRASDLRIWPTDHGLVSRACTVLLSKLLIMKGRDHILERRKLLLLEVER